MSKKTSTIKRLPENVKELIIALRDQGYTLDEVVDELQTIYNVTVSRSALHRHVQSTAQVSERIRASRELANAIGRTFGEKETSMVARANIELLHEIIMKISTAIDSEGLNAKDAMQLSFAVEKLTKASRVDFDQQLKAALELERRKNLEEAADVAVKAAKNQGLSKAGVDLIRKQILGMDKK